MTNAEKKALMLAQEQANAQGSTPPVDQKEKSVISGSKVRVIASGDELRIGAKNLRYKSEGERAGKLYARVIFTPSDERLDSLIDQIDLDDFDGEFAFPIDQETESSLIEAIENNMVNTMNLTISLRETDDGDTGYSCRKGKVDDELKKLRREKVITEMDELTSRRHLAQAKSKFYGNSEKMDAILGESLLGELQTKF